MDKMIYEYKMCMIMCHSCVAFSDSANASAFAFSLWDARRGSGGVSDAAVADLLRDAVKWLDGKEWVSVRCAWEPGSDSIGSEIDETDDDAEDEVEDEAEENDEGEFETRDGSDELEEEVEDDGDDDA